MTGYSSKSNASRAAKKAFGVDNFDVFKKDDGKWYFTEKISCAEDSSVVAQVIEATEKSTTTDGETQMSTKEEAVAAAEAALQNAEVVLNETQDNANAVKEDVKGFADGVKDAKAQLKKAKAYASGLADDAEDKEQAAGVVASWETELANRTKQHEDSKAAAKATKDAIAPAKKAVAEAKKALTAAKKMKAPKVAREEQNGVTKPAPGTKTGQVWEICDEMSKELKRPVLLKELRARTDADGISYGTANTQYSRWCTFYGVTAAQRAQTRSALREADKPAPVAPAAA